MVLEVFFVIVSKIEKNMIFATDTHKYITNFIYKGYTSKICIEALSVQSADSVSHAKLAVDSGFIHVRTLQTNYI